MLQAQKKPKLEAAAAAKPKKAAARSPKQQQQEEEVIVDADDDDDDDFESTTTSTTTTTTAAAAPQASSSSSSEFRVQLGGPDSKRFVTVSQFKKQTLVQIREFYADAKGELKPGKKGIALKPSELAALQHLLPQIQAEVAKYDADVV